MELNKIYNMDCLEGMKTLDNNSVNLIVTDPPYLMNYMTNRRKNKGHEFCKPISVSYTHLTLPTILLV